MQSIVGDVQTGPNPRAQVSCTGQITIPPNPNATQHNQLWMFTGSAWVVATPGLWSCVVKLSAVGFDASESWKLQMDQIQTHYGLPMLMLQTDWPPGTYDYSITGDSADCVWDLNDTMQVTVLLFENTA